MRVLLAIGSFVGAIACIVIIKMLDLPGFVTFLLVAALLVGVIIVIAKVMGEDGKKDVPAKGDSLPDKT